MFTNCLWGNNQHQINKLNLLIKKCIKIWILHNITNFNSETMFNLLCWIYQQFLLIFDLQSKNQTRPKHITGLVKNNGSFRIQKWLLSKLETCKTFSKKWWNNWIPCFWNKLLGLGEQDSHWLLDNKIKLISILS